MRGLLVSALFVLGNLACPDTVSAETTVIVVRHAEKVVEPGNRDPALTDAGRARAEALALLLRDVSLDAVYSSGYERCMATAAPAAARAGVEVEIRDPGASGALREEILRDHGGGTALVVGHSNTVPAMLSALGVADPPAIADWQYDDAFVVRIADEQEEGGASPTVLHLHYGAPTISGESPDSPDKPRNNG
ncbi:MAG: histidine phosphatase family protein [Phycisphaeraceae bacterium]|nr:histidine phosphatase family protein [Phycisphaeraceae bacterium]